MLVTGHPQFRTQNNRGRGSGIPVIPEWLLEPSYDTNGLPEDIRDDIDDAAWDVFMRLRNIFKSTSARAFGNTRLHDLACFTIHRLLPSAAELEEASFSPLTECLRYSIIIYMFVMQGPTYYSHDVILDTVLSRLSTHMDLSWAAKQMYNVLDVWFLAVAMVAASGTRHYDGFEAKARIVASTLELDIVDVKKHIRGVLWLNKEGAERQFLWHWAGLTAIKGRDSFTGLVSSYANLPIRQMYKNQ